MSGAAASRPGMPSPPERRAVPAASRGARPAEPPLRRRPSAVRALAALWLGALAPAWGEPAPARLAVTMLETDGAALQLRLRIPAGQEPTIDLQNGPAPATRRLVMAWPGAVALERPLPDPDARGGGALTSLALHGNGNASELVLILGRPMQAQLRRVGDSWVLRLEPDPRAAAAAAETVAAAPTAAVPTVPVPAALVPTAAAPTASAPTASTPTASASTPAVPTATAPSAAMPTPAAPVTAVHAGNAAPAARGSAEPEQLLLDVRINQRALADVVHAELWPGQALLLPVEAWTEARLAPPAQARAMSDGAPAYALDAIPGASFTIDRQALTVDIRVPPGAFVATRLAAQPVKATPPSRPSPGLVVNYDLSASAAQGGLPNAGAFLEGIAFGPAGNLSSSVLVRNDNQGRGVQRLDTVWHYDLPGRMETLVLGDTIGVGGGWSRPVRYAGLRWGREFGMRPGFVTLPQLSLSGEAALPSTVDLLVNDARRLSQPVAPGPFELSNVPIVTGAGELNLVVRDLLGHQSVVRQSYYASPRLLAPGLTDFSFEAGRMRFGYGADSRYRDGFAAATVRAGLTRALTGEARVELQAARRAAGVELAGLLGRWAVARVAAAGAHGSATRPGESGRILQAGIERSTPHGGAAIEYAHASAGYAPFGELAGAAARGQRPRERLTASIGGPLPGRVSGGASYVRQTRWDGERLALAGLALNMPVVRRASVNLAFSQRLDGDRAWRAGVNLSMPLDEGMYVAAHAERDSAGRPTATLSAARPAPVGPGLGWNLQASSVESQRGRATLQYNTNVGELSAELAGAAHGALAARVGARGSLGLMAGLPFASRQIGQGSFAVVDVGGLAGVPIRRSHQLVGTTNARGLAFVPGLLPWQKNLLQIDPDELPLDAAVQDVEQEVTPFAGSGRLVAFTVRRTRQALLVLRQPDGAPAPIGTRVRLLPAGPEFTAGLRGEVWLTDLPAGRPRVEASWPQGGCTLELPESAARGAPERIGPLTCGKETR